MHDKGSELTRNGRNIPKHNKGYIWQIYSQHNAKWEKTETISPSHEWVKVIHYPHSYLT
jgi:hypothetical protein